MLAGEHRVLYIHGEIAAPQEFDLSQAEKIYVPLARDRRQNYESSGVPADKYCRSRVCCWNPNLRTLREFSYWKVAKKESDKIAKPTIGCFNSGAYPREHVSQIILMIKHILQ